MRGAEAPFNMAIATLKRLDVILQQMRNLDTLYPMKSIEKQQSQIASVKQFYINSVPLFKQKDKDKKPGKEEQKELKELQSEILDLQVKMRVGVKSGTQVSRYIYSDKLEKRMNEIMIEIQTRLKEFFMPGKRDTEGLI